MSDQNSQIEEQEQPERFHEGKPHSHKAHDFSQSFSNLVSTVQPIVDFSC
jgi:hypothetical protein